MVQLPSPSCPIIPDNACILCITAAAGTELADAYSQDTVIASSPGKEVHDPWAFYLHAALLRQAFVHCRKFPTAASRSLHPIDSKSQYLHVPLLFVPEEHRRTFSN
uniref:Uncharacterized protein n=1 Tax=Solanum lycopersicum TaxID=4081 RepID=A0A3Q7ECL7_SOLLC